jgi:predicted dehydrogenase
LRAFSAMKIGVVGYGYWGPNLVRNFHELEGVNVKWVADMRPERRALAQRRYPGLQATESADDIFADPEVDAVVVATPVRSHYALAKAALERGKHVLLEKPMTPTAAEGEELIELADRSGLVLMVDHTFIYTGAVRKMKELIDSGDLGELLYVDSVRVNLGLFQSDVDVIWDLAPHDLSILMHLVAEKPTHVSVVAGSHTPSRLADVAYVALHYGSDFLANLHVSWLSPVKIRQMLLGGSRRMLVYNDTEPSEKIAVYDRGVVVKSQEDIYQTLVDYRMGDMSAPKLDNREALSLECAHFVDCIKSKKVPLTSGEAGLQVVRALEAASESLKRGGARILL